MKQRLIAVGLIFIAWMGLDFLIHNVLLSPDYMATSELWRPMDEMKMGLMYFVSLLQALVFTMIYCRVASPKTKERGIKLGVLTGILVGLGMGLGSYCYLPITERIATFWFMSGLLNYIVAGYIVGSVVKNEV